jgi:hypothetical protein
VDTSDNRFEIALSEVANALQAASLLAAMQRLEGNVSRDGISLEAAIHRAATAVRLLRVARTY